MTPAAVVGAPIRCVMSKWPDRRHWEFDGIYLGRDEIGSWIGAPSGTHFARPGVAFDGPVDAVTFVPDVGDFLATFNRPGFWADIYIDITTRPLLSDHRLTAVDLDLDVVRLPDGTVYVDDEDEFIEHQRTLGYPEEIIATAEASCRDTRQALVDELPPFDGRAARWLDALTDQ